MNIYNRSATDFATGSGTLRDTVSPGIVRRTMNQYLNPYQDQVISDVVGRMQDDARLALNDVQASAYQSGAFGGSRHGLVEAELMDRFNRNIGERTAMMAQQGFDTAAGLGQNRIAQLMQGGTGLIGSAQTGLGMGQSINADQLRSGMQQRGLVQQVLDQASGQYDTYTNWPNSQLSTALSALSGNPLVAATKSTERYTPGLFDYLSFGAGLLGGGK